MDNAIESAAALATGGIVAREADRMHAHRVDDSGHDASGDCANCGAALVGPFCHACGQHGHVHRTAGALVHDILHGVFHFEGKAWRTLPMLAFRPGELTRRYVAGERARFVSPMALFLFSVFLMFTIVANLPGWSFGGGDFFKTGGGGITAARATMAETAASIDVDIARLDARLVKARAEQPVDASRVASLTRRLAEARQSRRGLAAARRALAPADETSRPTATAELTTDSDWLYRKWEHAKENPKLMLYKVKTSAYKFSWALIPLSLPFLWILFPFSRRFGLYDHAVFATYSLTFMSLLTVALAMFGAIGVSASALICVALLIAPFHIYKQLKGAYSLHRWPALARSVLLVGAITWLIVPLFSLLLLYLGVAD